MEKKVNTGIFNNGKKIPSLLDHPFVSEKLAVTSGDKPEAICKFIKIQALVDYDVRII